MNKPTMKQMRAVHATTADVWFAATTPPGKWAVGLGDHEIAICDNQHAASLIVAALVYYSEQHQPGWDSRHS